MNGLNDFGNLKMAFVVSFDGISATRYNIGVIKARPKIWTLSIHTLHIDDSYQQNVESCDMPGKLPHGCQNMFSWRAVCCVSYAFSNEKKTNLRRQHGCAGPTFVFYFRQYNSHFVIESWGDALAILPSP